MNQRNKTLLGLGLYFLFWIGYFVWVWVHAFRFDEANNFVAGHVALWGDWAVHFTMGSAMAFRELFLTESPLLLGAPFRYPFFVNFVSAVMIRSGIPFIAAFTIPSFLFCLFSIGALFLFYRAVFKRNTIAVVSSLLFLLNGGLGFIWFAKDVIKSATPWTAFFFPARAYTNMAGPNIHWVAVIDSMLIPQRAFQLGFPLGLICLILVHRWIENNDQTVSTPVAAGLLWGLMPIVHMHSFVAVSVILAVWGTFRFSEKRKSWIIFSSTGLLVAIPLCLYYGLIFGGSKGSIKWFPGWYADNFLEWIKFWIKNWGLTPAVAVAGAILWTKSRLTAIEKNRIAFFLAPFLLLFIFLNLVLLQPWIWDNSKLLVWVSLGTAGVAGYAVVQCRSKFLAGILFVLMTASGFLDTYRLMLPRFNSFQMYTHEEMHLVDWVKEHTPTDSLWLTGIYHNNWLFNLTGRKVILTYEGWLWTHGYRYQDRLREVNLLYENPEDKLLYDKAGIDFIVIGPAENKKWKIDPKKFENNFTVIKRTPHYVIYSTGRTSLINPEKEVMPMAFLSPTKPLDEGSNLTGGLSKKIYPNISFTGPYKPSSVSNPNFHFDAGDTKKPFSSPASITMEGYLKITEKGTYLFSLESDDGSWLFLNDTEVVDNGGVHSVQKISNTVQLFKGFHKIKIKYFDQSGGAILRLTWKTPFGSEQEIPTEILFH